MRSARCRGSSQPRARCGLLRLGVGPSARRHIGILLTKLNTAVGECRMLHTNVKKHS